MIDPAVLNPMLNLPQGLSKIPPLKERVDLSFQASDKRMQTTFDQQVHSTPKEGIKAMHSMFPTKGAEKQIVEENQDVSETSIEDNQNIGNVKKEKEKTPNKTKAAQPETLKKRRKKKPNKTKAAPPETLVKKEEPEGTKKAPKKAPKKESKNTEKKQLRALQLLTT